MEVQHHKKTNASGHEGYGVHVCHKCGWPFPNPHPSAKHRRAHKRVCGTIDGYKLVVDSVEKTHMEAASDDEHLSDEDHKTPSSKMVERTIGRRSSRSSGVGSRSSRSNRSEDDVFSDTVLDFADTSVTEVVPDGVTGPRDMVRKVSENNTDAAQLNVENAVAGNLCSPKSTADGTPPQTIPHLRSENDLVENSMLSQDYISILPVDRVTNSVLDSGSEELIVGENITPSSTVFTVLETETEETAGIGLNKNLAEVETLTHGSAGEAYEAGSVEDVNEDTSDSLPAKAIGDTIEKQSDGLRPQNGCSSEVDFTKEINSSADYNDLMYGRNGQVGSSIHRDEDHNIKQKADEAFHILRIPEGLPLIENAEMMLRGYKDCNAGKSGIPAPLDSSLAFECVENSNFAMLKNQSASCSTKPADPKDVLSEDVYFMEDKLKEGIEYSRPVAEEVPVEGPAKISEIKASDVNKWPSSDTEAHPDTNWSKGGQVLSTDSLLQSFIPQSAKLKSYDNEQIQSITGDMAACNNKETESSNAVDSDSGKVTVDELPLTSTTSAELVEHGECKVDETISLLAEGDSGESEKVVNENIDFYGQEVKGGAEKREIDAMGSARSSEYAFPISESHDGIQDMELETKRGDVHMDGLSESVNVSSVIGKEVQNSVDQLVKEEINDAIGMGAILNSDTNVAADLGSTKYNNADVPSTEKKTESPVMEVYHDAMDSIQVENHCTEDLGVDATDVGFHAESLQVEDHSKLAKQHVISANDVLVGSSGQTDNIRANGGSVSVVSALSDAPAAVDTEAVASNGSQQSADAGKGNLKPESGGEGRQSDKSDVFEPPSFMTLVEPKSADDQQGDASKVLTSENPKHESTAALQAGWFPSLTHVANESPGRKRNEEIIAKVTNWSTGKQQHTPLKSLLGEAQEDPVHVSRKDKTPMENNGTRAAREKGIIASKEPKTEAAKGDARKEWNSPARYPAANIKSEKGKVKNRSYWAPFMCCSSVQTS